MKFKLSVLATAVMLSLTACGGGGGGGSSVVVTPPTTGPVAPPTPPYNPEDWKPTNIYAAGDIDFGKYSPQLSNGWYNIITVGDLNNDGSDDIVLGANIWDDFTQFVPLIIAFYDPTTKTFKVNEAQHSVMPRMQWTHRAVVKDFNRDGFNDLFVSGTGPDQGQPCGEAPVLMLGSSNGLVDRSDILPRYSMYLHQVALEDFNNDGITDFFLTPSPWVPTVSNPDGESKCQYRKHPGTWSTHLVLSNPTGWTSKIINLNAAPIGDIFSEVNPVNYNSFAAGDVDGDGFADLVVAGDYVPGPMSYKTVTLKGDGKGNFSYLTHYSNMFFGNYTITPEISLKDLNNDGKMEIVQNLSKHPGMQEMGFRGSVLEVYSLDSSSNTWTTVTTQYFNNLQKMQDTSSNNSELAFCSPMYWADINNDQKEDLVCSMVSPYKTNDPSLLIPRFWIKTNNGSYKDVYHSNIDLTWRMITPAPVKIDGKTKIVGIRNNSTKDGRTLSIELID